MPKNKSSSSKHDQRVKQETNKLKRDGWNVKADLPGMESPNPIGKDGRIPDIVATKQGHTRIVEVETPSSVKSDKDQQETFRRHAAQKNNTKFEVIVTDEK